MKINNLKINGFGKLKDKEIKLENGINIIYGKNEAGKSTLLKYISSMFYGLSKNKNGGNIPEIQKYEPWNNEEFSGKISYKLDNEETYEVYRDFKKKNPKIFNKNLEDISKEFNIDKTNGNQFFYDQVGVEEEIFASSIITKQAEVKLNEKEQNTLIQKISNILGTGEDTTSYTSIVNKLKKKINDEVGTSNTKERPINIIENRIKELIIRKKELENYSSFKFDIDEKIKKITAEIEYIKNELENLRTTNIKIEKLKEKENRIEINNQMLNSIEEDISKLMKDKKDNCRYESVKSISKIKTIIFIILAILVGLVEILIPNIFAKICSAIILVIYIIYFLIKYNKQKKLKKDLKEKQNEIQGKISILEQNKEKQLDTLNEIKEEYEKDLKQIEKDSGIDNIKDIIELIDKAQVILNEKSINLHMLKIDNDNAILELEKLVNIEEELENLQDNKKELEQKRENIKTTLEYLEIAYKKMKEQITPKFTEELSNVMENISDGKYKKVIINTNNQIIVEQSNGEYINAEDLSIGTIDQLYLSLRLATVKEITKENMPIILDEAFAYYDDNRLENILVYLANEYKNKQIIIFTCTEREKKILEELQIKFNLEEL